MYTVRQVGIEATDELIHLWVATFTQAYRDVHSAENIRAYCTKHYSTAAATSILSGDQYDCSIAYRENHPVGYYTLNHQQCPAPLDEASCELKQIYILSSEYGNGLGKHLFHQAVELARQASYRWIWLCVSDANKRAQRFYQKLGFKLLSPGPTLEVGTDHLSSTIMALNIGTR